MWTLFERFCSSRLRCENTLNVKMKYGEGKMKRNEQSSEGGALLVLPYLGLLRELLQSLHHCIYFFLSFIKPRLKTHTGKKKLRTVVSDRAVKCLLLRRRLLFEADVSSTFSCVWAVTCAANIRFRGWVTGCLETSVRWWGLENTLRRHLKLNCSSEIAGLAQAFS